MFERTMNLISSLLTSGLIIVAVYYLQRLLTRRVFYHVPMPVSPSSLDNIVGLWSFILQPIPSLIWGHLKKIHFTAAGTHYKQWFDIYGPTIQIRGAFGVSQKSFANRWSWCIHQSENMVWICLVNLLFCNNFVLTACFSGPCVDAPYIDNQLLQLYKVNIYSTFCEKSSGWRT